MAWDESRPRAVVLTALDLEYDALRGLLVNLRNESHPAGTHYEVGALRGRTATWQIAIAEIGEGNLGSATATERAIAHFAPHAVVFVGIAGSLKTDVNLGDVVVATRVYGIHAGRAEDQFLVRPVAFASSYRLEQVARTLRRTAWHEGQRCADHGCVEPSVHMKPIAAGEILLDSDQSPYRELLRQNYNDAAAIEMEGVGFLEAAHANNDVPAIVVRGISDLAAKKEASDGGEWRRLAAQHAAEFALALLADLDPDALPAPRVGTRRSSTPTTAESPRLTPIPEAPPSLSLVSLRELSRSVSAVLRHVEDGTTVGVTRHGRVIATIAPANVGMLLSTVGLTSDVAKADEELRLGIAKDLPIRHPWGEEK